MYLRNNSIIHWLLDKWYFTFFLSLPTSPSSSPPSQMMVTMRSTYSHPQSPWLGTWLHGCLCYIWLKIITIAWFKTFHKIFTQWHFHTQTDSLLQDCGSQFWIFQSQELEKVMLPLFSLALTIGSWSCITAWDIVYILSFLLALLDSFSLSSGALSFKAEDRG